MDKLLSHTPAKYDEICTLARRLADAKGAALIIHEGSAGSGLSVQCDQRLRKALPLLLRQLADNLERENAARAAGGS